jgi:cysteine desulfurase / selenocysteine lyase
MSPRPLYLDNAATSFPKPRGVHEAMARFATELGASAGRGGYASAIEAGDLLTRCRQRINRLFNGENPDHVIFTHNGTDALNLAIKGVLRAAPGRPHAICTHADHNSVLRPLATMRERGEIDLTRVPIDPMTARVDPDEVRRAVTPATRLIVVPHASNVTGAVQPIREIGLIARERGITFLVDAAQTAGHVQIDVRADLIDLLATPGHKGLLGPLGTGVLYARPGVERLLAPIREGGTGSESESELQPESLPDKYEAGSHNVIGIAGLSEGVKWILEQGVERLATHDLDLMGTFIDGVEGVDGLTYYGPRGVKDRVGVFSVRVDGLEPYELAAILESGFGVMARAGLHCAPLAHAALGTAALGGTTRLSFGPFLSPQDVNYATDALAAIATERSRA